MRGERKMSPGEREEGTVEYFHREEREGIGRRDRWDIRWNEMAVKIQSQRAVWVAVIVKTWPHRINGLYFFN